MRYQRVLAAGFLLLGIHAHAMPAAAQLPTRNGRAVVAIVNGDPISLDELVTELGPSADRSRLRQGRASAEEFALLDRLVTIKLLVQEGAAMGLDELPEIQKQVDVSARAMLRDVLFEKLMAGVKPDPQRVEKRYRDMVREWKTTSLLFRDEAAANRARKEIAAGATFAKVASKATAANLAKVDGDETYHGRKDYLPQIGNEVAKLKVGQTSPVIRIQAGFVIVKVVDIRYPENAAARSEARLEVTREQQQQFLEAHEKSLRKQYAVVNTALLKALNYEAPKPGLDALLKDKRVLAEVKGGAPVTVGDLTDYLRMQFFHGTDAARQGKQMNAKKASALDATLGRRLLNLEAQRLGIDKSNAYRDRVNAHRDSLVFDAFVQKVIAPANRVKEDEVKKHYAEHPKDYSNPAMFKIRSIAFSQRSGAESAMRKLKEGADHNWVAANAQGQVPKGTQGLLTFDGRPVTLDSMPEGLQKALAGAKTGDLRLYASPEGHFHVLSMQQVIAPTPTPYAEVREDVAKKVYGQKIQKAVQDYAATLRAKTKVETYLKRVG